MALFLYSVMLQSFQSRGVDNSHWLMTNPRCEYCVLLSIKNPYYSHSLIHKSLNYLASVK